MSVNINYQDLNLNMMPHPITGDVITLTGADAVKRAIRNAVFTHFSERPFQPSFGGGVPQHLFENIDPIVAFRIQNQIKDTITSFEPRAKLQKVNVFPDYDRNGLIINVVFNILNLIEPVTLSIFLERVR